MEAVTQGETLGLEPLVAGERAKLFPAERFDGLDCLAATFRQHAYAPHQHDSYVMGVIEAGCETFRVRGARHYARPGQITFVNPLETHDGEPYGPGYSYRMTYPEVGLIREVAASLSGRDGIGTPFFPQPLVDDAEGAALFAAAHRAIEDGGDLLAGEEMLLRFYARCLMHHADLAVRPVGVESGSVARAREVFEARYEEDLSLADLARLTGLPRHHLIRAFRRETGLTPHAYLVDVRVRRARERLRRGEMPGDVAAATGFCDQPHLTRAFKARFGVTPGAFRAAHAA
ncbi:AraC family transcriptional regulator [Bosea robiniae]|uniref:AraC-type DNA-binding protein n=1 Tax=Bosea robiniae TaxID=1036780 RepID=A0ABY0NQ90_9HYPH|nr:AraC family transcriptional regulator [Bosea robiniae]SDF91896.1 AraC-type DNA-binding protein [Bosea robiniae]